MKNFIFLLSLFLVSVIPASAVPIVTSNSPITVNIIPLDNNTITTGSTAINAINTGHRNSGGWISNPASATTNLCVNEVTTATLTPIGNNYCLLPGQTFYLVPSSNAVSVISSDNNHTILGEGYTR